MLPCSHIMLCTISSTLSSVFLICSELAQQRLSVASSSPYLRKLDLSEVLDSSEVDWQEHVDAAGVMNHTNHQSQGNTAWAWLDASTAISTTANTLLLLAVSQ